MIAHGREPVVRSRRERTRLCLLQHRRRRLRVLDHYHLDPSSTQNELRIGSALAGAGLVV